jgi:hypothetical protein
MPEQTVFTVHHRCGHKQRHDLSAKAPTNRAGYARLLARTSCDRCCEQATEGADTAGSPVDPLPARTRGIVGIVQLRPQRIVRQPSWVVCQDPYLIGMLP